MKKTQGEKTPDEEADWAFLDPDEDWEYGEWDDDIEETDWDDLPDYDREEL